MSGISDLVALYGGNVGVSSYVSSDISSKCAGLMNCDYKVDVQVIGDPAPMKAKDYKVSWGCNDGTVRNASLSAEANGQSIHLECPTNTTNVSANDVTPNSVPTSGIVLPSSLSFLTGTLFGLPVWMVGGIGLVGLAMLSGNSGHSYRGRR